MIRIYLDWNIFTLLKTQCESVAGLNEIIKNNKDKLQFVYTDAHFEDLMRSYSPENDKFVEDLKNMDYICNDYLLLHQDNNAEPLVAKPSEYFEQAVKPYIDMSFDKVVEKMANSPQRDKDYEKDILDNLIDLQKSFFDKQDTFVAENVYQENPYLQKLLPHFSKDDTQWDTIAQALHSFNRLLNDKEFYKNIRGEVKNQDKKRLLAKSNNWSSTQLFENLDQITSSYLGKDKSFIEIVLDAAANTEKQTLLEAFTSIYLTLDILGIRQDKLPKKNNTTMNIVTDSKHSYYAAYCDYFVVLDKNLSFKSKSIYSYCKVDTKVVTPKELIEDLNLVIHSPNDILELLKSSNDAVNPKNIFFDETEPQHENLYLFKLPFFMLNHFNYALSLEMKENYQVIFRRAYKNFSYFSYYQEEINVVKEVFRLVQHQTNDLEKESEDFVHNRGYHKSYKWIINDFLRIYLIREEDTERVSMIIETRKL